MFLALTVAIGVLACALGAPLDVSVARVVGGGPSTNTISYAISVLSSGNIVISGSTDGNINFTPTAGTLRNAFIRSYASDGSELWTIQDATTSDLAYVGSATDLSDKLYVLGTCSGTFHEFFGVGGMDVCFVKLDSAGNTEIRFLTGSNSDDFATGIVVNKADGIIYIVGWTSGGMWNGVAPIGITDAFLLKYSISGPFVNLLGFYHFGVADQQVRFNGVALDSVGNVWIAGSTTADSYQGIASPSIGNNNILIQKMSPSGTVLFARLFGGATYEQTAGIALDATDNAYVVGYSGVEFDGSAVAIVVKYNSAGDFLWSQLLDGTAADVATAVSIDTVNDLVIVTGHTTSPVFLGVANPNSFRASFVVVLTPSGAVFSVRLFSLDSTGRAVATKDGSIYLSGGAYGTGTFEGQAVDATMSAYMLKVEGFGGVPIVTPTVMPTFQPTTQPTKPCLQWALGDYGETCSATCSKLTRVCKSSYFNSITTPDPFLYAVSSAINVRTGGPVGPADNFCSQGATSEVTVGVPVAFSFVKWTESNAPSRTTCSFPTSAASATCDAAISVSSVRRFCPCVDNDCDGGWFLGYTGDSCDATCAHVGGTCQVAPLANIVDAASFSEMVSSTTALNTNQVIGQSAAEFCTEGTNLIEFAKAPAAITMINGAVNHTLCTYPSGQYMFDGACDRSFQDFPAQRFCNCRLAGGRRLSSEAVQVKQETTTPVAAPATRTPKLRGHSMLKSLFGGV